MTKETDNNAINITHCIFDVDGTLIDTERIYTEVNKEFLASFGHDFNSEVKFKIMGRPEKDGARIIIEHFNLPLTVEEFTNLTKVGYEARFSECKPLPGVVKLVKHLKRHNLPLGVGTSACTEAYNLKVKYNQELFEMFECSITGDNPRVKKGKPSPDIFEEVAKDLGSPNPENCLVFEDSLAGVKAALNAGMKVIWIPDPNLKSMFGDLNAYGATEVLDSMKEFDPVKYGLPPYEN